MIRKWCEVKENRRLLTHLRCMWFLINLLIAHKTNKRKTTTNLFPYVIN